MRIASTRRWLIQAASFVIPVASGMLVPCRSSATSDEEVVHVEFVAVGEVVVTVQDRGVQQVELLRHVFELDGEREVGTSAPYYLSANNSTDGNLERESIEALATGVVSAPIALPLDFSLMPGTYCDRIEFTSLLRRLRPRVLTETQCFGVTADGESFILAEDEISAILHPLQEHVSRDGTPVLMFTGMAHNYSEGAPEPQEIGFATPVEGGGVVGVEPASSGGGDE